MAKSKYIYRTAASYIDMTWLGDDLVEQANEAIKEALEPIFAAMESDAKSLVLHDSGELRNTINGEVVIRNDGTAVVGFLEAGDKGIEYAVMQEVGPNPGSGRSGRQKKGRTWKFQPYIRPAFNKWVRAAEEAVSRAIEKISQ